MCRTLAGQDSDEYAYITRSVRLGGHATSIRLEAAGAEDGVCSSFGRTHDITSLFISDGSEFTAGAAEHPTRTIVTLAIRQADDLAGQMTKGNL